MIYALAVLWWAIGMSSMLWMRRGDDITWGDVAFFSMFGFIGPGLWVIVGIVVLAQANFWSRPVFTKRRS